MASLQQQGSKGARERHPMHNGMHSKQYATSQSRTPGCAHSDPPVAFRGVIFCGAVTVDDAGKKAMLSRLSTTCPMQTLQQQTVRFGGSFKPLTHCDMNFQAPSQWLSPGEHDAAQVLHCTAPTMATVAWYPKEMNFSLGARLAARWCGGCACATNVQVGTSY